MPPEQADRLHTVAWEAGAIYSVTPGKFAFTFHADEAATRRAIDEHPDKFFCSTFEHTKYVPYCSDFGPVDLDRTVTFCRKIRAVLCDPRISGREVVFYAEALNSEFRTNAAYLLGAYLVLHEGWSPEKAAAPFERIVPSPWAHFRDATDAPSDFELPIRDCLAGLNRAAHEGWLNIDSFDRAIYREQTRDGYTTVCPRFIAFQGPVAARARARPTWAHPPAHFLAAFQRSARRGTDVTAVVRLNEASLYDPREFSDAGIALYDLEFEDCTVPSAAVVKAFFAICDRNPFGAIAVHCKAGLGRTGTLIALWIMVMKGWSARETIAWLRIARPGSVIGQQQHFLLACERASAPGGGGLGSVFRAFARPGDEHAARALARNNATQVADALARRNARDRMARVSADLAQSVRAADAGSAAIAARIRTLALRDGSPLEPPPPPPPPPRHARHARPALSSSQVPQCSGFSRLAQRCSPRAGRSPRTPCSPKGRASPRALWGFGAV